MLFSTSSRCFWAAIQQMRPAQENHVAKRGGEDNLRGKHESESTVHVAIGYSITTRKTHTCFPMHHRVQICMPGNGIRIHAHWPREVNTFAYWIKWHTSSTHVHLTIWSCCVLASGEYTVRRSLHVRNPYGDSIGMLSAPVFWPYSAQFQHGNTTPRGKVHKQAKQAGLLALLNLSSEKDSG